MGCHVAWVPRRVRRSMASTLLLRSAHKIAAVASHFGHSWTAQNLRCGAWGVIGGSRNPMLCRACQEERRAALRGRTPGRVLDQLCSRCGNLLWPEDMVKRVLDKQSLLARFGLARKPREDR